MESQKDKAIDEMYDLFVNRIESEFRVNEYSENYNKNQAAFTLVINDNELDVSFVNNVNVIFNYGKKNQQVIPIEYEDNEWVIHPYTDWNSSARVVKFDEQYLNKIVRHFKGISQYR